MEYNRAIVDEEGRSLILDEEGRPSILIPGVTDYEFKDFDLLGNLHWRGQDLLQDIIPRLVR